MKFTTVKRAVNAVHLDGDDLDQVPEVHPVHGQVTFTPLLNEGDGVQVETGDGMVTVVPVPVTVRISDGVVMHRGAPGVQLFAGGPGANPDTIRWRADFKHLQSAGVPVKLRPVVFDAVPDGEVDLTRVAPVAGFSGGVTRGEQGEIGPRGPQGEIGPRGPQGEIGPRGPQGEQGNRGWSITRIDVDENGLTVWGDSDTGETILSTVPLDNVTKAAADKAVTDAQTVLGGIIESAQESRDAAKESADSAYDSAKAAATSEGNAQSHASTAAQHEVAAKGHADDAEKAATRAGEIAESTSWDGDEVTINGKTSPSLTGPAGRDGVDGKPGPQGEQGPQGERGPAGRDGVDGKPGPQGEQGPQGDKGEPGTTTWGGITNKPDLATTDQLKTLEAQIRTADVDPRVNRKLNYLLKALNSLGETHFEWPAKPVEKPVPQDIGDYASMEPWWKKMEAQYGFKRADVVTLDALPFEIDFVGLTNMSYMFSGCSSLTAVPDLDTSQVTDVSGMFAGCSSLTDGKVRLIRKDGTKPANIGAQRSHMRYQSGLKREPFYTPDGQPIN